MVEGFKVHGKSAVTLKQDGGIIEMGDSADKSCSEYPVLEGLAFGHGPFPKPDTRSKNLDAGRGPCLVTEVPPQGIS
jgi:hypothetical protein